MRGKILFFSVIIILCLFSHFFIPSPSYASVSDSEFIELCRSGSLDEINEAISIGVNVDARSSNRGDTAVMVAAANNPNPKVIEAIIQAGAVVSRRNNYGETPLMHAARYNMNHKVIKEIITILINAGEDINERDGNGRTPIFSASEFGSPETVLVLLNLGADATIRDTFGQKPIDLAEIRKEFRSTEAIKRLRAASQ